MTVGDGNLEVQNIRKEGQTTWTPMMPKGNHPFFQVKTAMARGPHAATPPLPSSSCHAQPATCDDC